MAKQTSQSKQIRQEPKRTAAVQSAQRKARSRFTLEYGIMLELLRRDTLRSGVTQERIAERLGKSQSHVSMCLNKEREISFVDLWKWCDVIGVRFEKFVKRFEAAIKESLEQ
jgi:hypothetical protein